MIVLPESPTSYRCSLCGERYWSKNETVATIRRKEYENSVATTTVWEFHICDECLKKLVNK